MSCLFSLLVKWMSLYFSGENLAPCRPAYSIHPWCASASVRVVSAVVFPYVIREVSSTNPVARVLPRLRVSSRSALKNRNRIGESVEPYGIPEFTRIRLDYYSLNLITIVRPSRNEAM